VELEAIELELEVVDVVIACRADDVVGRPLEVSGLDVLLGLVPVELSADEVVVAFALLGEPSVAEPLDCETLELAGAVDQDVAEVAVAGRLDNDDSGLPMVCGLDPVATADPLSDIPVSVGHSTSVVLLERTMVIGNGNGGDGWVLPAGSWVQFHDEFGGLGPPIIVWFLSWTVAVSVISSGGCVMGEGVTAEGVMGAGVYSMVATMTVLSSSGHTSVRDADVGSGTDADVELVQRGSFVDLVVPPCKVLLLAVIFPLEGDPDVEAGLEAVPLHVSLALVVCQLVVERVGVKEFQVAVRSGVDQDVVGEALGNVTFEAVSIAEDDWEVVIVLLLSTTVDVELPTGAAVVEKKGLWPAMVELGVSFL
jgi:hypothetical protein